MTTFLHAAAIRAAKTVAQAALSLIGTTAVILSDVDWGVVASGSALAGILSLLGSVAFGLPETPGHGLINPNHDGPWTKDTP